MSDEILASDTPIDDEPIEWEPEKRSRAQVVATITAALAIATITAMLLFYAAWGRV